MPDEFDPMRDVIRRVDARLAKVEDNQKQIQQALWGLPGYPSGLVSDVHKIETGVEACREENKEEARDVRRAIRNLGFTVSGSVAVLVLAHFLGFGA